MFKGDNFIGVLMVGLCLVVAAIMIWSIGTGERLRYDGPAWLAWLLGIIVIGGSIFGLVRNYRMRRESGGTGQWPNPSAGERSLLDRLRGKGNDSESGS